MFRLLKLLFMLALFVGFAWLGSTVPLGQRTLFGHLHAIGSTKESKDLLEGTKQSARPLVDDVRRRIGGAAAPAGDPPQIAGRPDAGPPQETVTANERRQLRRLIGAADKTTVHR